MSDEQHELPMCDCGCTMTWSNPNWTCPECGKVEVSE